MKTFDTFQGNYYESELDIPMVVPNDTTLRLLTPDIEALENVYVPQNTGQLKRKKTTKLIPSINCRR